MAIAPAINVITRATMAAAAGDLVKVTVPLGATVLLVRPVTAAGKLADTGVDAAGIGTDYATITADAWTPWPVAGLAFVYLAHTNNSGVIELLFPCVSS